MDLAGSFNQVLQVGAEKEIAQVDEVRMVLVLNVDCSPSVLPCGHLPAVDHTGAFAADHGERSKFLDGGIGGSFLIIQVLIVVRVHSEVVELELLPNSLLESSALLGRQGIGLCDDWHNVHNIGELLQDHNVNRFEAVTRWLNEEQAAMDAGILNVTLSLCGKLFAEVGGVLIFDVLDHRIPARQRKPW